MISATSNRPDVPPYLCEISIAGPGKPLPPFENIFAVSIGWGLTNRAFPFDP
jgi:hypothetical protein